MSTPIYTTEEDRQSMQFGIRTKLALHQHENISDAIEIVKRRMAEQIARAILERRDVFWERSDTVAGFSMLEYGLDLIVLTPEEMRQIKQENFKRGMEHACGFMRVGP